MGGTKETVKTTTEKAGATAGTGSGEASGATNGTVGKAKAKNDSVYTAHELAANAKALFGVMPECVTAALRMAKVEACTVDEAKIIVKNFLNQEVG